MDIPAPYRKAINGTPVEIAMGDITDFTTGAYIVPQFHNGCSNDGVAKSILSKCGSEGMDSYALHLATMNRGEEKFGNVVVTESEGGKAWFLIHAVSVGSGRDNEFKTVQDCIYNALKAAEEKGISTVTAPAMGTGRMGRLTPEQSAKAMLSAVERFKKEGGKLDEFRVVVWNGPSEVEERTGEWSQKSFEAFKRVLQKQQYKNAQPEPGKAGETGWTTRYEAIIDKKIPDPAKEGDSPKSGATESESEPRASQSGQPVVATSTKLGIIGLAGASLWALLSGSGEKKDPSQEPDAAQERDSFWPNVKKFLGVAGLLGAGYWTYRTFFQGSSADRGRH